MENKVSIMEYAMQHAKVVIVIISLMILFGIYAIVNMPRQEFPEFTIRQGLVIGVYPGAKSHEVEEQLTTAVEKYLFSYKEVNKKKTYSISRENAVIIFVELNDDVKERESKEFWLKVQFGLNDLKIQLPAGVRSLTANNDFGDTSALLLTLESDNLTYRELAEYLKKFENELRKVESVSKIRHYGFLNEQISVYLQNEKIAYYGIKPANIYAVLKTEGDVSYTGDLDDGNTITPVHIPAKYHSEAEIGEQIVYADPSGKIIRLKDIARIERGYQEPDSYIKNNGKKCLLVSLEMQSGNNIVQFGTEIDKVIAKFSKTLPQGVKISKIANQPEIVQKSISSFFKEFLMAIIAVILVTMLLLPLRVASVAGSTIPISILITFGVLYLLGIELHTVSLAALIIVLGMVVDNAIVVIDSHVEKLDSGKSAWISALESVRELFMPVLAATLAIIASFLPLRFFLKGTGGDFIKTFPVTIMVTLLVSLVVVIFILPYMNFKLIKNGIIKNQHKSEGKRKKSMLDRIQNLYDVSLEWLFKWPKTAIFGGVLAIITGIIVLSTLQNELFPKTERNQFAVEIYLPNGSSLAQSGKVVTYLEDLLEKEKRVCSVTSFTGTSSPRFMTTYAPQMPCKNYAQLIVNTISNEATIEILDEYDKKYRNIIPNAFIKWKQIEMSPYNNPIEIRVTGDSIATIKREAKKIEALMRKDNRISWLRNDYEEPSRGIDLDVYQPQANQLGYTNSIMATSLMIGLQGFPLTTLWEGDYPINVMLLKEKKDRNSIDKLADTYISSPILQTINPVRQLANIKESWSEGTIVRRNGTLTLTVIADVNRGIIASDVFNDVVEKIPELGISDQVNIEYGGVLQGSDEQYPPMVKSLLTSIVIIFFILLFLFKKIRLSLLIMMTMPLSLLGTALGLKMMGYPFGFTAFLGFISLCGIVVRNGIIMIGYAEELKNVHGMSALQSAISAGKRRMRPIFLTSASAAVGVIPMIMSRSPLWGPLGSVICFGLLFSMILTLYVLPVAYWYLTKKEKTTS